jgi:glycosyltransferase involved in cell wall biosynthesis
MIRLNEKNILIVTCQGLPHSAYPSTGGGLRSLMLGKALKACGHKVNYSLPKSCTVTAMESFADSMCDSHSVDNIHEIVDKCHADVVLFCNWGLAAQAPELDVPVIVDINGSLVLENHHRRHSVFIDDAFTKIKALERADLVIAGSCAQKHYLISWGLLAGMNPDAFPIEVVPFSLSPDLPIPSPPSDPVAVMAGYQWPWLDGEAAVKIVSDEMAALNKGHLMIYSDLPLYHDVIHGEDSGLDATGNLCGQNLPRSSLHDPIPFEQLISVLSQSSFAVDVWKDNLERELAFPSRTVAYLWSGLPVITSAKSSLAEFIESYNAGWIINDNETRQLSDLVRSLLLNPEKAMEYGANAQKLVRDHLTWDTTIAPISKFCNSPFKRHRRSPLLHSFDRLRDESNRLSIQMSDLRHTTSIKIEALEKEKRLLGEVHRRPKGLSGLIFSKQIWRKLRRWMIEWPLLIYLFAITTCGYRLHDLKQRWLRRWW